MSHSTELARYEKPLPSVDWVELNAREADGLSVSLFWDRTNNEFKVSVLDVRLEDGFDVPANAENCMQVFHHPFAFAEVGSLALQAA